MGADVLAGIVVPAGASVSSSMDGLVGAGTLAGFVPDGLSALSVCRDTASNIVSRRQAVAMRLPSETLNSCSLCSTLVLGSTIFSGLLVKTPWLRVFTNLPFLSREHPSHDIIIKNSEAC